jgi:sulfofructose kinase
MTSKSWDILGIGCVAVDDLLYVPHFPAADTKVRVIKRERQCGGLTGTALVTASRLGARCAFAGRLGFDELSRIVEENFRREKVDISFVPKSESAPVPCSVIVVGPDTRNIFYSIEGEIGADDLLPPESVIRSAGVLFLDQYGMTGNLRAASIARAAGIPVVADLEEVDDPRFSELLRLVDHLVMANEVAERLSGETTPERAAKALWRADRKAVVITRGIKGSWFLGPDEVVRHERAFKVKTVDTTGCGDVFHGAYAAALIQGHTLQQCVRVASAAAALKATQPGGQRGIPTREQLQEFLNSRPELY